MATSPPLPDAGQPVPRSRRAWVWIFVGIGLLTALAIGVQLWFNLRQQLTLERLEAARALWRQAGPSSYDLEYTKRGSATGTIVVQVRKGRVLSATLDGQPLEPRLYPYYDMAGLFDDIGRFLEIDTAPGSPRTFTKALFDPVDGHLIHYIRSVTSTRQRLEINVRLRPLADEPAPGARATDLTTAQP